MAVGALWAGIAGVLKVDPRRQRGHLDDHAERHRHRPRRATCCARPAVQRAGQQRHRHQADPAGQPDPRLLTRRPGATRRDLRLHRHRRRSSASRYWFVLSRTRFGFDLRATGQSEPAAVASGVDAKRMVDHRMLISGAVAGLVGMPILLGARLHLRHRLPVRHRLHRHRHRAARPQQPGRHRVRRAAVGLPGRAVQPLQILDRRTPRRSSAIMQGVIVLSVVIAYEVVRRYGLRARAAPGRREAAGARRRRRPGRRCRHERRRHPPRTGAPRLRPTAGADRRARWILAGRCWSSLVLVLVRRCELITGADELTSRGTIRRALAAPCRSASPASAACGPSAPASSTSASKA